MADLSPLADRLNDTEISANAPLTESLFRRFGSNINFLLDFLGISDGATAPSGALNDLSNAISTIEAHTIDLVANITTSGITSVGTFNLDKFISQKFYIYATSTSAFGSPLEFRQDAGVVGNEISLLLNVDGAGNKTLPNVGQLGVNHEPDMTSYLINYVESGDPRSFSKMLNVDNDYAFNSTAALLAPIGYLDWRDPGTNFELLVKLGNNRPGVNDTIQVYRELILDVGSLGF